MHKNYFLYEEQLKRLGNYLTGKTIRRVLTRRRNEVQILFREENSSDLVVSIDRQLPGFFLQKRHTTTRPAHDLFSFLNGREIGDAEIIPFDKLIRLDLSGYFLIFRFFGRQPNIIVLDRDQKPVASFKKHTASLPDPEPVLAGHTIDFRSLKQKELEQLLANNKSESIENFLLTVFTALNKLLVREILLRCALPASLRVDQISPEQSNELFVILEALSREFKQQEYYIYYSSNRAEHLSLCRLQHLEQAPDVHYRSYNDLNVAWSRFLYEVDSGQKFERTYRQCRAAVTKKRLFLERSLGEIQKFEDIEKLKAEAELKGNLLLTWMHDIKAGSRSVQLKNIFSEKQESITIKLNPQKSIAENAQIYFRKYKDTSQKKLVQSIKKGTIKSQLEEVKTLERQLETITRLTKLEKFYNTLLESGMIQGQPSSGTATRDSLQSSFKLRVLENKWFVYIGKSGENNDLLTFRFARKWDIWLHAQGLSGAHVILRLPGRDHVPPNTIIEQAARIAAAHSSARHSSTVAVIYTTVNHVQRIRKAPPGTVKVRNEKVLFVEPLDI